MSTENNINCEDLANRISSIENNISCEDLDNRISNYRTEVESMVAEINGEIETLQKMHSAIFMAYGELTGVMQVILRYILSKASEDEKREIDELLAQASKEFVDMLKSSTNVESDGEENNA